MREFAVTDAMPQKNWATAQMNSRNMPRVRPVASMKIWAGGSPVAAVALGLVVLDRCGDGDEQDHGVGQPS